MTKTTCAMITALNEAETIAPLVRSLQIQGLDVIVIDDGSTDKTGTLARAWDATVIRHDEPHGIAESLLEAWKTALHNKNYTRFIQIDAGGSHDPAEIRRLMAFDADIVIGSRFCKNAEYIGNPRRAFFSKVAAILCNFASPGAGLTDWTSGYRAFSRRGLAALAYLGYGATGHAWQIEVLYKAIRAKLSIAEAPITYKAGRSSLRMKSVLEAFGVWLELLFS